MATLDPRAAIRKALIAYLKTVFVSGTWPTMWPSGNPDGFSENWPTPGQLPTLPHISVLTGPGLASKGYGVRIEKHTPNILSTTPTSGGQGTVLYSFARAWIDFSIECWADFEPVRDDMCAAMDTAMDVDPNITLGSGTVADFSSTPGLVLPLGANYFSHNASCIFDPVPQVHEETKLAEVNEWRATFSGTAHMYLCRQETVYLLTDIILQLRAGPDLVIAADGVTVTGGITETSNIVPS